MNEMSCFRVCVCMYVRHKRSPSSHTDTDTHPHTYMCTHTHTCTHKHARTRNSLRRSAATKTSAADPSGRSFESSASWALCTRQRRTRTRAHVMIRGTVGSHCALAWRACGTERQELRGATNTHAHTHTHTHRGETRLVELLLDLIHLLSAACLSKDTLHFHSCPK